MMKWFCEILIEDIVHKKLSIQLIGYWHYNTIYSG